MSDEKNKYITAYGSSNEDSYGRGDVTDISTKYNMLTTNPLSDENAPEMNSYSSDGSYNQDIFGWKCFNSPVSFRNGIYGECCYVTTFSDNDFHGIKIETYDIGDESNQSKIVIKADNIELDGDVGDLEVRHAAAADYAIKADALSYNGNNIISTSITSVNPSSDSTVSLGSANSRFSDIYANSIIARTQLFKSSDSFELYDIRPIHIKLLINFNNAQQTPAPVYVSIEDGDEFFVDSNWSINEFGNAKVSESDIKEILIYGNEAIKHSYFMTPSIYANEISFADGNLIDMSNKRFKCVSNNNRSGAPTAYAGGGAYLTLDFYIIVMRIE